MSTVPTPSTRGRGHFLPPLGKGRAGIGGGQNSRARQYKEADIAVGLFAFFISRTRRLPHHSSSAQRLSLIHILLPVGDGLARLRSAGNNHFGQGGDVYKRQALNQSQEVQMKTVLRFSLLGALLLGGHAFAAEPKKFDISMFPAAEVNQERVVILSLIHI